MKGEMEAELKNGIVKKRKEKRFLKRVLLDFENSMSSFTQLVA